MNNNIYKTRDLAEATALAVSKIPIIGIEKKGVYCWFVFADPSECIKISNMFFYGELLVNAREYWETTKRLKNRIFAENQYEY